MLTSWKLGRVAGIDLYLHSTFLLVPLFALMGENGGPFFLAVILLTFGCVVLHEFGHAMMARRYGIGTADITLYPIGGVARLERMPRSAGPELAIAVAGPAVNVAIAAGLYGVLRLFDRPLDETVVGGLLFQLMWINVGLLLFNMLPVFPMDGGRVLRALLSTWLGRSRATTIAANLGRTIALVAGVTFLLKGWYMQILLAAFIYVVATLELRGVRLEEARRMAADDWPAPPPGYRWVDRGDGVFRLAPAGIPWNSFVRPPGRPWS